MVDRFELGREFFAQLEQEDEKIAREVAAGVCQKCERGALHRSDYSRKPRGGLIAPGGEGSVRRFSLCCDQEGCRKRATPPSLRFLGRRVYLGAVVTVASMLARVIANATELRQVTGVPVRTTRRWLGWWGGPFVSTSVFVAVCARLVGVAVSRHGELADTGAGAAVLGNPARCVAWLANKLASFGAGLKAGDIILPGAVHRMIGVAPGDVFQAEFDHLGTVTARFAGTEDTP